VKLAVKVWIPETLGVMYPVKLTKALHGGKSNCKSAGERKTRQKGFKEKKDYFLHSG